MTVERDDDGWRPERDQAARREMAMLLAGPPPPQISIRRSSRRRRLGFWQLWRWDAKVAHPNCPPGDPWKLRPMWADRGWTWTVAGAERVARRQVAEWTQQPPVVYR